MAYTIKITNSSPRVIETQYRMQGDPRPPLSIGIQPLALLNEVNFPDENHYKAWRKQNDIFFTRGILLEDEKREALLRDKIASDTKSVTGKVQGKAERNAEDLQAAADNVNASLKIETQNLAEGRKKR